MKAIERLDKWTIDLIGIAILGQGGREKSVFIRLCELFNGLTTYHKIYIIPKRVYGGRTGFSALRGLRFLIRHYGELPTNIILLIDYDVLINSSLLNSDPGKKLGQVIEKYTGCFISDNVIQYRNHYGIYLVTSIKCDRYDYQLHILASGSHEVPIIEYNLLMLLRDYMMENLPETKLLMDIEKDLEKLYEITDIHRRKDLVKGLYSRYKKLSGIKTTNNLLKYMNMNRARKYFIHIVLFFIHIFLINF